MSYVVQYQGYCHRMMGRCMEKCRLSNLRQQPVDNVGRSRYVDQAPTMCLHISPYHTFTISTVCCLFWASQSSYLGMIPLDFGWQNPNMLWGTLCSEHKLLLFVEIQSAARFEIIEISLDDYVTIASW